MPTPQEWLNSLVSPYKVIVSSSHKLVSDVQVKQQKRANEFIRVHKPPPIMKPPVALPMFQPDQSVNIRPIELLLSIGRITTPPVANLVDICVFR